MAHQVALADGGANAPPRLSLFVIAPRKALAPDTVGSEARQPTALRGRADRASADKPHRLRALYRGLHVALLLECWGDLQKAAARGVDGVPWHAAAENPQAKVEALVERRKQKRYRATLIRRRYMPKGTGHDRPLGMPVLEAKLLMCPVKPASTASRLGSGDSIATMGCMATLAPSIASVTGPCKVPSSGSIGAEGTAGVAAGGASPRSGTPTISSGPASPR